MIKYDNKNWFGLLFDLRGSVYHNVIPKVFLISAVSAILTYTHLYLTPLPQISPTTFTVIGLVLGLLLVFRTNTAYDRYWEGRKLWGVITNASRTLAIETMSFISDNHSDAPRIKRDIMNLVIVFPMLARQHLNNIKDLKGLDTWLSPRQIERLDKSAHLAVEALSMITQRIAECVRLNILSVHLAPSLESRVATLTDVLGACERIRNTPIPIAYVLHLKRMIFLFCIFVNFALLKDHGWLTVPTIAVISYAFNGIEDIGVEIEDPFGDDPNDLPLEDIIEGIRKVVNSIAEPQI